MTEIECIVWNQLGFSPQCNLVFPPIIELPPPIEGTYIRPPYIPPGIIVVPPIETVAPPAAVPLPATPLLLMLGFAVLCAVARRK